MSDERDGAGPPKFDGEWDWDVDLEWLNADPRRLEWRYVMSRVLDGHHPSATHLRRLIRELGVPDDALIRDYIASRIDAGPQRRPMREPENWERYGSLTRQEAAAVMDLIDLYYYAWCPGNMHSSKAGLRRWEITEAGPRWSKTWRRTIDYSFLRVLDDGTEESDPATIEVEFVKVESRAIWRVKDPKQQARAIVARARCISAATLKEWERKFDYCYGRYMMEFFS